MLKVAQKKGYGDLYEMGIGYVLHPKIGMAKAAVGTAKSTYKGLINLIIDKPKFALTYEKGIDNLKKGDFKAAEKQFKVLQAEIQEVPKEALKEASKAPPKGAPKAKAAESKAIDLTGMGGGIVDNLYEGLFESLKKGETKFAGIEDPVLKLAKPEFDAGRINSLEEFKAFVENHYKNKKK